MLPLQVTVIPITPPGDYYINHHLPRLHPGSLGSPKGSCEIISCIWIPDSIGFFNWEKDPRWLISFNLEISYIFQSGYASERSWRYCSLYLNETTRCWLNHHPFETDALDIPSTQQKKSLTKNIIPSRELTYPTWGIEKIIFKNTF